MQKKSPIAISLLISLILAINVVTVFSYDKSMLPYHIKIGLYFGSTAKSTLSIESQSGFNVGIYKQDEFINLFELDEYKISLRKDNYYSGEEAASNEYIEGLSHVQVGEDFDSYREAHDFLNSLNIKNENSYLYYENGWKVLVGPYINRFEAKEQADSITDTYGYITEVNDPSTTRVQVVDTRGNIMFLYNSSEEVYFTGKNTRNSVPVVNVNGTSYRGGITAKRLSNSDMTVINKLPLEEYLYGVVPGEMPASWHIESLKAQAVAARVFAITNFNKYKQYDFNLCTTVNSQVYKGYTGEHPNTNRAVDETKSNIITLNGQIVEAYYHSNSGGYTEDSENVWTNPLPHVRGVKDDFSLDAPNSNWTVTFTKDEIKNRLATNNIFIGDILDIEITSTSNNGRILSLVVYGTQGNEVIQKEKNRAVFGLKSNYFSINSSGGTVNESEFATINGNGTGVHSVNLNGKYVVTASGVHKIKNTDEIAIFNGREYKTTEKKIIQNPSDTFVFNGKGFGHGVGMSQYGAKKMAELGYKYDEILKHYYTGVKVE